MRDYLIFDGVDSRDFGVFVYDGETDSAPEADYTSVLVTGKNGEILISNRRFNNIQHLKHCLVYEGAEMNLEQFRAFLLSRVGYKRLEDSTHPDEFYQACYQGASEVAVDRERSAFKFDLLFTRKPERWLRSGERQYTLTATGMLRNPTYFDSKPLVRVYGNGTVAFGGVTITVSSNSGNYTDIDCEIGECYRGAVNRNAYVSISDVDFPKLSPGINNIQLTGVTRVIITPRWYTL